MAHGHEERAVEDAVPGFGVIPGFHLAGEIQGQPFAQPIHQLPPAPREGVDDADAHPPLDETQRRLHPAAGVALVRQPVGFFVGIYQQFRGRVGGAVIIQQTQHRLPLSLRAVVESGAGGRLPLGGHFRLRPQQPGRGQAVEQPVHPLHILPLILPKPAQQQLLRLVLRLRPVPARADGLRRGALPQGALLQPPCEIGSRRFEEEAVPGQAPLAAAHAADIGRVEAQVPAEGAVGGVGQLHDEIQLSGEHAIASFAAIVACPAPPRQGKKGRKRL